MKNATCLLSYLLVYAFFLSGCQEPLKGDLIIKNANVINVENGAISTSMDVVINADRITAIQPHKTSNQYEAEKIVDGSGQYLIPGLWDMHTHTWWAYEEFFPLLIANGVTGVREMFGNSEQVKLIRKQIAAGKITGPEYITAGPIVDGKPAMWPRSDEADTPEKGREIVRQQKEAGADFIKVYSYLDRETYLAIADECHKQGIPFNGHIPDGVPLEEAVAAGHNSSEHFDGILPYCSNQRQRYHAAMRNETQDTAFAPPGIWAKMLRFQVETFDENRVDSLIALLSGSSMWMCPTNTVNRALSHFNDSIFRADDRIKYMPDFAIRDWEPKKDFRMSRKKDWEYKAWQENYQLGLSLMKRMLDGGVKFLAGTDYPNPFCFPGFSLHDELEILVDAGFTPLEALQTATLNPAVFLEKSNDYGTVGADKVANIVLLNANPLEDINNVRDISWVVVKGQALEGESLRADLEKTAAHNLLPKIREEIFPTLLDHGVEAAIEQYHSLKTVQPDTYNFDEGQLNGLGYDLLKIDRVDDAIAIMQLNMEMYPDYANGWDSLGEAYEAKGDSVNAKIAYNKAAEMGL